MRGGLIESHAIKEISLGGIDLQRDLEVDHENVSLISLFGSFVDTLFSLIGISFRIIFTILGQTVEGFSRGFVFAIHLVSGFSIAVIAILGSITIALFEIVGGIIELAMPRLPEILTGLAFGLACLFTYYAVVWLIDFLIDNLVDIITVIALFFALALASD